MINIIGLYIWAGKLFQQLLFYDINYSNKAVPERMLTQLPDVYMWH